MAGPAPSHINNPDKESLRFICAKLQEAINELEKKRGNNARAKENIAFAKSCIESLVEKS